MGWTDLGFMGSDYYETPNIDALSKLGMVFTNGYASAANCAPSRASLMTGQYTTRHTMYTVGSSERGKTEHRKIIPIKNTRTLDTIFTVMPKVLHQMGYNTIHAGKWHIGKDPKTYGFDINIGGGHNGAPGSYFPPYNNVSIEAGENEYLTDLIMEKTLEVLDSLTQPFFLNYAPYAVHTPIQAAPNLIEKYNQKQVVNGHKNAAYASMIENLDRNIGLLITRLKENNIFDNSLIIFTSDNGGLFGITEQKPLRAGKGSYYEGGIRVPFFFVWKERIDSNTKSPVPISNIDVFPTIMEIIQTKNKAGLSFDGESILAILKGEQKTLDRPLFWHYPIYLQAYNKNKNENRDALFRTRPGSVIRYRDWKLQYYFEDNEVELFNLKEDIGEQNDLSLQNPEKTEELLEILKAWWKDTNAPIPTKLNPEYVQ